MSGSRTDREVSVRAKSPSAIVAQEEQTFVHEAAPNEGASGELCIENPSPPWNIGRLTFVEETYESPLDVEESVVALVFICDHAPGV